VLEAGQGPQGCAQRTTAGTAQSCNAENMTSVAALRAAVLLCAPALTSAQHLLPTPPEEACACSSPPAAARKHCCWHTRTHIVTHTYAHTHVVIPKLHASTHRLTFLHHHILHSSIKSHNAPTSRCKNKLHAEVRCSRGPRHFTTHQAIRGS
jgi:hypothetical protein